MIYNDNAICRVLYSLYEVLSHVLFYLTQVIKGSYLQNGEYPDSFLTFKS